MIWKGNPALEPLLTDIKTLREDPSNARKHPESNLNAIKNSLTEFGQQKPIVTKTNGTTVAGSGSTLIACEQLDRNHYGIEIEPRYVDVTIARWEKHTNQKANRL